MKEDWPKDELLTFGCSEWRDRKVRTIWAPELATRKDRTQTLSDGESVRSGENLNDAKQRASGDRPTSRSWEAPEFWSLTGG